jgi:COMPASS component SWD3
VKVWDIETSHCQTTLLGHTSRIWDISSSRNGEFVASGSGDGTIKLWSMTGFDKSQCVATITNDFVEEGAIGKRGSGDVYSVKFHPSGVTFNPFSLYLFFLVEIYC